MAKMVRKGDLASKQCAACGRPFAWRKKWEKVWNEVKYCSDRCRGDARRNQAGSAPRASARASGVSTS